jgi:hypothetical protein
MGQAKQRGTYDDRVSQAVAKGMPSHLGRTPVFPSYQATKELILDAYVAALPPQVRVLRMS